MNILITAATSFEIQPSIDFLQTQNYRLNSNHFSILVSGIGGVSTAYHLTKTLRVTKPDFCLQAGIAGSFDQTITPGSVVCIEEEFMGDLGAAEGNDFKDVFDLSLMEGDHFPFIRKGLKNPIIQDGSQYGLPKVSSIGINEITTNKKRIDLLRKKFNPGIESMEGAAFHYVCLQENINFLQIRAVSNMVGERNKAKWNLVEAVDNLNKKIIEIARSF